MIVILSALIDIVPQAYTKAVSTDHFEDNYKTIWIYYPDPSDLVNYYIIKEVEHISVHITEFDDGTAHFHTSYKSHATGVGCGSYEGERISRLYHDKWVSNEQAGDDGVYTTQIRYYFKDVFGVSHYQLVITYANGEIRVVHERIP